MISRRNEEIRALGREKNDAFVASQRGIELKGLSMGATRDGTACALTDNFLLVVLPGEPVIPNQFVSLRILRNTEGRIEGEIVEAGIRDQGPVTSDQ